ncbi:MAG: SMI1/KNR4 family protein [Acidobacteriota bacterium]
MIGIRQLLVASGVATAAELYGLSAQEIEALEAKIGLVFPGVYREFLSVAGRSAGRFASEVDVFFPDVVELQGEAKELIAECKPGYQLPDDALIFTGYQGYQYTFFRCLGDDPPVYRFFDDDEEPTQTADSLSAFLREMVATTPR